MILDVTTHSGRTTTVKVDDYDATLMNEQLNDNSLNTVVIGDKVFSRIDVKYVGPEEGN